MSRIRIFSKISKNFDSSQIFEKNCDFGIIFEKKIDLIKTSENIIFLEISKIFDFCHIVEEISKFSKNFAFGPIFENRYDFFKNFEKISILFRIFENYDIFEYFQKIRV